MLVDEKNNLYFKLGETQYKLGETQYDDQLI